MNFSFKCKLFKIIKFSVTINIEVLENKVVLFMNEMASQRIKRTLLSGFRAGDRRVKGRDDTTLLQQIYLMVSAFLNDYTGYVLEVIRELIDVRNLKVFSFYLGNWNNPTFILFSLYRRAHKASVRVISVCESKQNAYEQHVFFFQQATQL